MGLFDIFKKSQAIDETKQYIDSRVKEIETSYEEKSFEINQLDETGVSYAYTSGFNLNDATLQKLYLQENWVYSAITAIATTVSSVPLRVKAKKIIDGEVVYEYVEGTDLEALLKYPNPYVSNNEMKSLIAIDLFTTGNAYIYLEGVEKAKDYKMPEAMYRLNPALVSPRPSEEGMYIDHYVLDTDHGTFQFKAKEVLHLRLPNPASPYTGLSPLVPAFKNVLLDRFSMEYNINFYRNGARVGGVIKHPGNLTKKQMSQLQRSFEYSYQGTRNQHRTVVLSDGMDYQPITATAAESQMLDFMKYNRDSIISALKVPPIKLGFLEQSSYSNAEVQEKFYYTDTILPLLNLIEEGMNLHPFITPPDDTFLLCFDTSNITALREDYDLLASTAEKMLKAGLTVDEVREMIWKVRPLEERFSASAKPLTVAEIEKIGSEIVAPLPPEPSTPEDEDEPEEKALPSNDMARISQDVESSVASFEDRVSSITSRLIEDGLPPAQASVAAIQQALAEGLRPAEAPVSISEQEADQSEKLTELVGDPNITPVAVGTEIIDDDEDEDKQDKDLDFEPGEDHRHKVNFEGQTYLSSMNPFGEDHQHTITLEDGTVLRSTKPIESREGHIHEWKIDGDDVESGTQLSQDDKEQTVEEYKADKEKNVPEKYSHIDFKPPQGVAEAAERGLELREEHGRGGTAVGVARARDLSNRENMTPDTIRRMVSFFARHEQNSDTPPEQGNGMIAWLLWGGDPGKAWSGKVARQMDAADRNEKMWEGISTDQKEVMINTQKDFIDRTERVEKERLKEIRDFFAKYERVVKANIGQVIRTKGLPYKVKQEDADDILSIEELNSLIASFIDSNNKGVENAYQQGFDATLPNVELTFQITDELIKAAARDLTLDQVKLYDETTRKQLKKILDDGVQANKTIDEMSREISAKFEQINAGRAKTIARTEVLSAFSEGQQAREQEVIKQFPDKEIKHTWITMQDSDVREADANHVKLHGVQKTRGEEFEDGLSKLRYPRDRKGAAGSVINCRCTVISELVDKKR